MLVVTTNDIPGYEVRHVLGQALGITGRSRNPFKEGMRKLHGDGEPPVLKALTRWRLDAIDDMTEHARALGANAVVAMRFDHRNVGEMWEEICAYGTAVYVVAAERPAEPGQRAAAEPAPLPDDTPPDPEPVHATGQIQAVGQLEPVRPTGPPASPRQ